MYKGFKLDFSTFDKAILREYYVIGNTFYDNQKTKIHESLSQYIDILMSIVKKKNI